MKRTFQIAALLFFINSALYPQTTEDDFTRSVTDTSKIKSTPQTIQQIQIRYDEFELYRSFKNLKMQIPLDGDPNTIWLRTSLSISNEDFLSNDLSPHFLEPLQQKYYRDSKLNLLRYALGMAQAGAVGYLAYKHIKKYGFLK